MSLALPPRLQWGIGFTLNSGFFMSFNAEQSMLATFILPIAQALRSQGLDAMELVEEVGIDPSAVINADRRVPIDSVHDLLARSVELSADEAFGLVAAQHLQPQVLNGLGLAWLASDTVYDGLKRTVRFSSVLSTGVGMQLREDGEFVHLVIRMSDQVENFAPAAADFAVGIIMRMCRLTMGEFIAPVKIRIQRPRPADPARFESMLSSTVEFDCEETCLTFYLNDISVPLATGDPALARANDAQTQAYLDRFSVLKTSRDVIGIIVEKLPDGPPTQQQIADSLHVSNRTLQRRLKEEGTSFMDLLQDTRLDLARNYLLQPTRSIVETSYLLGFSEPSTFSRAFKRWTGQAPTEFRATAVEH
jgi:AraC-like DNA-binding protein